VTPVFAFAISVPAHLPFSKATHYGLNSTPEFAGEGAWRAFTSWHATTRLFLKPGRFTANTLRSSSSPLFCERLSIWFCGVMF
jgi:hypothetical protein